MKSNVGGIPEVTADEDVDRDVEIAEEMERKVVPAAGRTARQRLEDIRDMRYVPKEDE